jgi:hypothetical protein
MHEMCGMVEEIAQMAKAVDFDLKNKGGTLNQNEN